MRQRSAEAAWKSASGTAVSAMRVTVRPVSQVDMGTRTLLRVCNRLCRHCVDDKLVVPQINTPRGPQSLQEHKADAVRYEPCFAEA